MCGIVAYVGAEPALPILLDGLKRLEYRGYDSAGVVVPDGDRLWCRRVVGRVASLVDATQDGPEATVGIAHTRWATHGGVTVPNAHPHLDGPEKLAIVHNGIIDNFSDLKRLLEADGIRFRSETDSEILAHLIRKHYAGDPLQAVCDALANVQGTYGIAVLFAEHPDLVVVARNGSPLVVGLGDGETVVASDPQAVATLARRVVYLDDHQVALVTASGAEVQDLQGTAVEAVPEELDATHAAADRAGYPHYMLKEIHEQPASIRRCLAGRIDERTGNAKLGGLNLSPRDLLGLNRITSIACGTSHHAGLVGALAIESLARLPAQSVIASEHRHSHPIVDRDALFFAISQSGETLDTLGAIREVQLLGGEVMGIVNVVGSTIARTCGRGVYVHSGPEIAVASTKAFTSQVTALLVFTLMLARTRALSHAEGQAIGQELLHVPSAVERCLHQPTDAIDRAVEMIAPARYVLFLGRGYSHPVALEGALKLKEITYVPCEGYPAGEMKHGPIAMIEEGTPVVLVAPADGHRDRCLSNAKEVEARGARLIIVHSEGDDEMAALADVSLPVPRTADYCSPLVTVLPLQLLAYRVALELGRDIDKPRNLAKSVTVE